jgi:hypothetical protein
VTFPEPLENLLPEFDAWVRGGKMPSDAAISARKFGLSAEQCEVLKQEYLRRNRKFIDYTDPRVLRDNPRIESWYSGSDQVGAWCWPAYKKILSDPEKGWDPDDLVALDRASTKILASLPHPGKPTFNCRGLVVGYVQSGKTANYAALISKAADVGYRLFIVLSGTTSSLRQQTQGRLNSDVVVHAQANWSWLTYPERDFSGNPAGPDGVIDVQSHRKRVIAVVKKNVKILDRLIDWLADASPDTIAACSTIIVDDEADNASVNTNDPDVNPRAINERIRKLLRSLKRVAYVGYTATPFANIFIDPRVPEDLFPRNFIFDLDRPKAYFGAERIFGRDLLWFDTSDDAPDGLDIVRDISTVNPDEPGMLLPTRARERFDFEPETPPSLPQAIQYFLLATAARYARAQSDKHSSMLVHTTMYVNLHDKMEAILNKCLEDFKAGCKKRRNALESLWTTESTKVAPLRGPQTSFGELWTHLPAVLARAEVVVDNGFESTLQYTHDSPKVVIAVGGNTFSRGRTLEGLVVSYYIRHAGAYDTLLQMGRWFGYRQGYEDLPRIWMTNELQEQFLFLAGIEEEIRQDIRRLEKEQKTPLDLAIRVRTHPRLMITARNKMGTARLTSASFSDRTLQSFLFSHDDEDWLESNLNATKTLGAHIGASAMPIGSGHYLKTQVEVSHILDFLRHYQFHPDHAELRTDLLEKYVLGENDRGSLRQWNVAWLGQTDEQSHLKTMDLGLEGRLNCISRTRYRMTTPCNIKSLISKTDRVVDLHNKPAFATDEQIVDARNGEADGVGLLLLYPISKNSTPEAGKKLMLAKCKTCGRKHQVPIEGAALRHPLQAVGDVVGAALVFPRSSGTDADYMAANLETLFEPEQVEDGELIPDDSVDLEK